MIKVKELSEEEDVQLKGLLSKRIHIVEKLTGDTDRLAKSVQNYNKLTYLLILSIILAFICLAVQILIC